MEGEVVTEVVRELICACAPTDLTPVLEAMTGVQEMQLALCVVQLLLIGVVLAVGVVLVMAVKFK